LSKNLTKHISATYESLSFGFLEQYSKWKGSLYKISRNYEAFISKKLKDEIESVLAAESKNNLATFKKSFDHFEYYIQSFREKLNENLFKNLGIKLPDSEIKIEVSGIVKPDIYVTRVFDLQIDLLGFLFPMFIFRKFFKSHFLKQMRIDIEKNFYRTISDLTEAINKKIILMKEITFKHVQEEINAIENVLSYDDNEKSKITRQITFLRETIRSF
jgi:hypothetical protein